MLIARWEILRISVSRGGDARTTSLVRAENPPRHPPGSSAPRGQRCCDTAHRVHMGIRPPQEVLIPETEFFLPLAPPPTYPMPRDLAINRRVVKSTTREFLFSHASGG